MQVSVETTQGLERRLTITIPAEKIDTQVKTRLIQLSKTQRIDGFRPGKVPASVINKRYGKAVREEVAGDTIQRNFYEAVVAEKLNPAGQPSIETVKNETGADLEFVATFEVYPEVTVAGLDAIEVEQPVVNVNEKDLDAMIDTLRKQNATWTESKKAAKAEDKVTIDFIGKIDGEEFEGGKAEAFELEMGQNKMIPGFEDGIVGLKAGKEKTITVSFPEDYHAENLKGKEATFDITLTKVEAQELPELTEEFASLFNVADIPALRAEVEKNMKRELEQTLKGTVKEQIISGLIDNNELDVPKALIDGEVDVLRKQAMQRFGENAANMPELPANLFEEQAVRRVKIGLLLNEVIKGNELKVDDERVTALIENMASAYEDPTEVVEYYKNNQEMMQQMRGVALEEQAIEFVLAQAKVKEVEKAFDEVMNKQA